MSKNKILITTSSFGKYDTSPIERLEHEGFDVKVNPYKRKLTHKEALELYTPGVSGVIAGTEDLTEDIINQAKDLKVISRLGIGLDNVDLKTAKKNSIKVFNTPNPVIDAVAELTLALIMASLRNIATAHTNIKKDVWKKEMGFILSGKTIGIIGLGNIGKRLVELLKGFTLQILAYDKILDKSFAKKHGIKYTNLDSLLKESDIITVHLPLNSDTRRILNSEKLSLIKSTSIIVNTSRASLLDEKELFKLLREKRITGAALDVFGEEPYKGPLRELDNVVLTPHIGSYAKESRIRMENEAVENLIKGLKGKK